MIHNFHELIILYLIIALDSNHQLLIDIILKHFELNDQIKIIKIIKNYIDISLTPKLESINGLQKLHITIAMIENKAKGKEQAMTAKIAKLEKEIEEMKQGENVILNMNIYNSSSSIASSSEKDKEKEKEKEKESDKKKIESNSLHAVSYSPQRIWNPNENNKLTNETFSIEEYKTPSKFSKVKLTDQDYLKIILKKDYIISQLRSLLEERELASKIKDDYDKREEIASLYKKELDEFKARYEVEFELMASAMYNLGLNYLSYREKNLLQYHTNWLSKQKQQYYYNKEDKTEY